MNAAMASLDNDKSGSVSFGEFQTWWDEQSADSQDAFARKLEKVAICIENDEFRIENDGFCIENDEFFVENDELCIENNEFHSSSRRM